MSVADQLSKVCCRLSLSHSLQQITQIRAHLLWPDSQEFGLKSCDCSYRKR